MMGKYTCGFCGEIYDDMDLYFECVSSCRDALRKQIEEDNKKRFEEINTYISKVKAAKDYYEAVSNEFKTKYPKEYEVNFGHDCFYGSGCNCHVDKEETGTYVNENKLPDWASVIEASYESNGNDEPKVSVRLNGNTVNDDSFSQLLADPTMQYIAKLLKV